MARSFQRQTSIRSPEESMVTRIEDYEFGMTLGTGSFSRVKFANHKNSNTPCAIKIFRKTEVLRLLQIDHVMNEKQCLERLNHPFIIKMLGKVQDPRNAYIIMEFVAGGDFFLHLRRMGKLDFNSSRFYAAQVVLAIDYMHSLNMVYRDLKPENLLFDSQGYLKLCDFGFSKTVEFVTYTLCGTPEYLAPEVLLNRGHGKGVDWWTLGVFMFEIHAGQPPFTDPDTITIYQQILAGKYAFPRSFDRNMQTMVKKLLTTEVSRRMGCQRTGAEEIKRSKVFQGFDLDGMLTKSIPAPYIPNLSGPSDTSNFEQFPEFSDDGQEPVYKGGRDVFESF